ncbi:hypothetical protein OY671_010615, partial [Metschnikowia pulcherrima]
MGFSSTPNNRIGVRYSHFSNASIKRPNPGSDMPMAARPTASSILYQGELFADYFQLYSHDEGHPDSPDDYTDEVLARRLMVGPYAVVLQTARNMTVPIRVEW